VHVAIDESETVDALFPLLRPTAVVLPYPARSLAAEIILLFLLALLDATRIFLGMCASLMCIMYGPACMVTGANSVL